MEHRQLKERQVTVLSNAGWTPNVGWRRPGGGHRESSKILCEAKGLETAPDDRWDPEFHAGIPRQKFKGLDSKSDRCLLTGWQVLVFYLILPKTP